MTGRDPQAGPRVLGPAVADSWYPADADRLATEIDRLLRAAGEAPGERRAAREAVRALLVPHAGLVYSGAVAAEAFRHVRGAVFRRVILLGPSHHAAFAGAALPAADLYRTPLGDVPFDLEARKALTGRQAIRLDEGPFAAEHSLEIELPFLQRCLAPGWRLLPLLLGAGSPPGSLEEVADALVPLLDPSTLVVVSSDFTHYGPRFGYVPFESEVPARLRELDLGAVEPILDGDAGGFADYVRRTGATVCGRDAILVLLRLPVSGWRGALERYDTSGRITGDWSHSVSYVSLCFRAAPAG